MIILSANVFCYEHIYQQGLNASYAGNMIFNSNVDPSYSGIAVNNPYWYLVTGDFMADGIEDYAIFSTSYATLTVYTKLGSSLISEFTQGTLFHTGDDSISNMVFADMDHDGVDDLVYGISHDYWAGHYETGTYFYVLNYTDGHVTTNAYNNATMLRAATYDISTIACDRESGTCIYIMADVRNTGNDDLRIQAFNYTKSGNSAQLYFDGDGPAGHGLCLPAIKSIPMKDFDNDGNLEAVITYAHMGADSTTSYIYMAVLQIASNNLTIRAETHIAVNVGTIFEGTNPWSCPAGNSGFTPATVAELDGNVANGPEIIFGLNKKSLLGVPGFELLTYHWDGTEIDNYPELSLVGSTIYKLSNVVVGDFFEDTGAVDFCVLGVDSEDLTVLRVLCGSEQTEYTFSHELFYGSTSSIGWNYTSDHRIVIHSVETDDEVVGGNSRDFHELLTSYGTLKLVLDSNSHEWSFAGDIDALWVNPKGENVITAQDDDDQRQNIFSLGENNFWFIDDAYGNHNCEENSCVGAIMTNPCMKNNIKTGSAVEISVATREEDNDAVRVKFTAYYGQENYSQFSSWSFNGSSGTIFQFLFVANKTGLNNQLLIELADNVEPTNIEEYVISFSVSDDATNVKQCDYYTYEAPAEEGGGEILTGELQPDNAITTSVEGFTEWTGLSRGIIWVIIMLIFVGSIAWYAGGAGYKPEQTFIFALIVLVGLGYVGYILGMVGFGFLLVLILIIALAVAISFRGIFSGSSGG